MVLAAACGHARAGKLEARLIRPPHDTVRFEAAARAYRCGRPHQFLVRGIAGGNGVLIWARFADSLSGAPYPLLARGDSLTPRGAMVSARFMVGELAHGATLDSGTVTLSVRGKRVSAAASGSGLDPAAGQRVAVTAAFESVPVAADTASCGIGL